MLALFHSALFALCFLLEVSCNSGYLTADLSACQYLSFPKEIDQKLLATCISYIQNSPEALPLMPTQLLAGHIMVSCKGLGKPCTTATEANGSTQWTKDLICCMKTIQSLKCMHQPISSHFLSLSFTHVYEQEMSRLFCQRAHNSRGQIIVVEIPKVWFKKLERVLDAACSAWSCFCTGSYVANNVLPLIGGSGLLSGHFWWKRARSVAIRGPLSRFSSPEGLKKPWPSWPVAWCEGCIKQSEAAYLTR